MNIEGALMSKSRNIALMGKGIILIHLTADSFPLPCYRHAPGQHFSHIQRWSVDIQCNGNQLLWATEIKVTKREKTYKIVIFLLP